MKLSRRAFLQWSAIWAGASTFVQKPVASRVRTFVGTGARGMASDGDTAAHTELNNPFHIVIGPDGFPALMRCVFTAVSSTLPIAKTIESAR